MRKNMFKGKKQMLKRRPDGKTEYQLIEAHKFFILSKKSEGLRERTIFDHENHFKYFVNWLALTDEENMKITDLDIAHIWNYIQYMTDKGLSPVTVNIRLRTLKCFIRFCAEEGYINKDISSRIKLMKTEKDTLKILNDEQVSKLLKVVDTKSYTGFRDYVSILLMIDTGMRASELMSLTTDMIDFDNKAIYLPARIVKNRIARTLPLSNKSNRSLFQLVNENELAFGVNEVFLSIYGTPFQARSLRKRLTAYGQKAGLKDVRVSPHSFRHYFVKCYILNGGDAFTLQKILGHADMQMVREYIQMTKVDVKIQHNQFSPVQRLKF